MSKIVPYFLLSGEGKTDFGDKQPGTISWKFKPGPLFYLVESLFQRKFEFSPLEINIIDDFFEICQENELNSYADSLKNNRKLKFSIPGKKYPNLSLHGFMARMLGLKAKETSNIKKQVVIPIFFRDTDSTELSDYHKKIASIKRGFASAGYPNRGISMLAKPKSEAWLLCIVNKYKNGHFFENNYPTDKSQNSLKNQLAYQLQCQTDTPSRDELVNFITSLHNIDIEALSSELYSFRDFKNNFEHAVNSLED